MLLSLPYCNLLRIEVFASISQNCTQSLPVFHKIIPSKASQTIKIQVFFPWIKSIMKMSIYHQKFKFPKKYEKKNSIKFCVHNFFYVSDHFYYANTSIKGKKLHEKLKLLSSWEKTLFLHGILGWCDFWWLFSTLRCIPKGWI